MIKSVGRRLFPIHLASIDSFFLADDRPDYPMTFASNLYLSGEFQRAPFEAALNYALQLHPLLQAIVRPAKQNRPCWVSASHLAPVIDWGDGDQPVDLEERQYIDLRRETGLRVWIRQGAGRAHLIFQFHHACCDGTGAHRFIGDVLAAYGTRTTAPGERPPQLASYDPQLLKVRNHKLTETYFEGSARTNIKRALGQGVAVFGRRIAPLEIRRSQTTIAESAPVSVHASVDGVPQVSYPALVAFRFSAEEHKLLRTAAGRLGVMLNDLLLAEMFQTMRDWNVAQGRSAKQRLRIMMPSDMRLQNDYAMPAANMTSYNFITRSTKDCVDPQALVTGIRDETLRIKNDQRGRLFIDSIMLAKKVPGLIPFLLSSRRCLSTVTVSNMGDPTRRFLATFPRLNGRILCGDVVLDDWLGVSPLRPQTRASVSIITMYRQLTVNVRLDPHGMSLADTQAFLNMYVERLASHLFSASLDNQLVSV